MAIMSNKEQCVDIGVDTGRSTPAVPPARVDGANAGGIDVVVLVRRTKHHPVGDFCFIQ